MKLIELILAFVATSAMAQDRIIGLVEIPALHDGVNSGAADRAVGPLALFAEPDHESEVAVVVRDRRQLESREHGYEQVSATVYALAGNTGGGFWFQLRFVAADEPMFGWLNQADAGRYRSVDEIVRSGLTYLTDEWDGRLYALPSLNAPSASFTALGDRPDVNIADVRQEDGELWYLAVLVHGNICSDGGAEILGTGWVPAYSENGGATVWHYSRGC